MTDTSVSLSSRMRGGKEPRHISLGEIAALKEAPANLQQLREQRCEPLVEFDLVGREVTEDGFTTPSPRRVGEEFSDVKGTRTWGDVLVDEVSVTTLAGLEVLKFGTEGWTTSKLRLAVACALGKDHVRVQLVDSQGRLVGDKDSVVSPTLTCILVSEPRS